MQRSLRHIWGGHDALPSPPRPTFGGTSPLSPAGFMPLYQIILPAANFTGRYKHKIQHYTRLQHCGYHYYGVHGVLHFFEAF